MAAVERGVPMLIEKPLATDLAQSARVLKAITDAKLDAVVGYTQRFRRKWLGAKEKVRTGALGDVTLVTSRAFMNRLVAIDNYKRTDDPSTISPMVISGTHALDIVMWYMEKKTPVECYARSVDKVLGPALRRHRRHRRHDHVLRRQRLSPQHLLGAAGDLAGRGLLARGRHQRHRRRAHHRRHPSRHGAGGVEAAGGRLRARPARRLVDFMGSYPPGDMALGELRGPMADETVSWLNRVALGLPTQAATAAEAHRNLMLTKALDLSAKTKKPVKLPLEPGDERAAAWRTGSRLLIRIILL